MKKLAIKPRYPALGQQKSQNSFLAHTRRLAAIGSLMGLAIATYALYAFFSRYTAKSTETPTIKEFTNAEYPANPAALSQNFGRYSQRNLSIIQRDATHFDFVLESKDPNNAKILLKNIDVSLFTPKIPSWVKEDAGLEAIALTTREWNRQQVSFPVTAPQVEILGGDGYEKTALKEIALTNNCLNAGYWEIALFNQDDDNKTLYYQGWFTFPMGHYQRLFEQNNQVAYRQHWWRLEHWQSPDGTQVDLAKLRQVSQEHSVAASFPLDQPIFAAGEQARKVRTVLTQNLKVWRDFYSGDHEIQFATFQAPGFYNPERPWKHEYWRIGEFKTAKLRTVQPVGSNTKMDELELEFADTKTGEKNKLILSGFQIQNIPQLPTQKYGDGLYIPLGIGLPPLSQSYEKLTQNPTDQNPYFGLLLDEKSRWIDNHTLALDGVTLHRDEKDAKLLHVYLLSYERHTLIGHIQVNVNLTTVNLFLTDSVGKL
jgi:hypothetical protein